MSVDEVLTVEHDHDNCDICESKRNDEYNSGYDEGWNEGYGVGYDAADCGDEL